MKLPLKFRSPIYREEEKSESSFLPINTGFAKEEPIKPGRSSEDPNDMLSGSEKYVPVDPEFALEWLPVLENLAVYNQDVGYAVDNIVQLANTPWSIKFRDDVNDATKKEILKLIEEHKNGWYNYSEGLNSYHSDMYAQAAINGAMSTEIVPNKTLDNITLVRVAPKHIRFMYDRTKQMYVPFQVVSNPVKVTANTYGLRELNTTTYKYVAWRRIHEGPYPVPPFLTAVRTLDIQADIIKNLGFIIQKLGMLGFLSVNVTPPEKKTGETDLAYYNRASEYLNKAVYPQLEKNLNNGMVVGFKGSHEFKMQASNNNPAGAQQLVKMVELMLFAGLKQDPNMLGRNYSTTETFGRVILAKMSNQVKEYQNMMNAIDLDIFKLFVMLRGFDPDMISGVEREPAMIGDKVATEQARSSEIDNAFKLRDGNIIDQQQTANELGYEKPAGDAPETNINTEPKNDDDKTTEEVQEEIKVIEKAFLKNVTEWNYDTNGCHGVEMNFLKKSNFNDKQMSKFANDYSGKVNEPYSEFTVQAVNSSVKVIQSLNELVPLETAQDAVYLAILKDWEKYYSTKLDAITKPNVNKIYKHYRNDDSIFPEDEGFKSRVKSFEFEIPDPLFDISDFRTMDYAAQSDTMYLGKFITDENTKSKIYGYLEENYIDGHMSIGNDPKSIAKFKSEFTNIFNNEAYKIRRVIDTSVNNLRNDANIQYINQAELTQYQVVEIGDTKTCEYCLHMDGQIFEVSKAVSKIDSKISASPENVKFVSPFATSVKIDEFTKMSAEELQSAGFSTPSYHSSCRGRIVAQQ